MKTIVMNRLKKWILLATIGCSAYFVGYYLGTRGMVVESQMSSESPAQKP